MMQLTRKRSFNASTSSRDFRREFKGSFLEEKFRKRRVEKQSAGLKNIVGWMLKKNTSPRKPEKVIVEESEIVEDVPVFDTVPNEVLFKIIRACSNDKDTMLACRRISTRFNACTDKVADKEKSVISRLVISGLGKKGIEMRWISYVGQKTNTTIVSWASIKEGADFSYSFSRFLIQRIILKNAPLCDELVEFLRLQLQYADLSKLIQLSLNTIDFSTANCLTLHRLLAAVSKNVEIFEVTQPLGMRIDSITDEHLTQLDASKIRRICIDGIRFAGSAPTFRHLKIGDASLKRFARLGAFPTMILDRCAVSTQAVCDYTKMWFEQCNESEKQLRSQVCTVKRCPRVKGSQFEAECRRRGLVCKNRRGSGSLTLYNVQEKNTQREFTIALAALEDKEFAEKLKISPDDEQVQPIAAAV